MNIIYHWLGFTVLWGALTLTIGLLLWVGWEKYSKYDWFVWIRTFLFRRPLLFSQYGAGSVIANNKSLKNLPKWKRNLLAHSIRYSKRVGYKTETE